MLRMKAPMVSAVIVFPSIFIQRGTMLSPVQELHSLFARDFSERQRPQHRHRVGRGAVEMPGGVAGCVKARYRPLLAQHFRFRVGGETAEGVGDGADQWVRQIWR